MDIPKPMPNNMCVLTRRVDPDGPGRSVHVFSAYVLRGWDNVPAATEALKSAVLNFRYGEHYATSKEIILTAKIHVASGADEVVKGAVSRMENVLSPEDEADMLNGRIRRNRITYNKLRKEVCDTMNALVAGPLCHDIFVTYEPLSEHDMQRATLVIMHFTTLLELQRAITADRERLREIGKALES